MSSSQNRLFGVQIIAVCAGPLVFGKGHLIHNRMESGRRLLVEASLAHLTWPELCSAGI